MTRKKRHAHHGGAWKVAYADFVTAMMALFMVLWLVSQTDQESRERLGDYFPPRGFSQRAVAREERRRPPQRPPRGRQEGPRARQAGRQRRGRGDPRGTLDPDRRRR